MLIIIYHYLQTLDQDPNMGQCAGEVCGLNPLKMLMDKYGDEIVKFISIEKAKIFIDEKFEETKKQLETKIDDFKKKFFDEIQQKQKQLDQLVEKVRKNLDEIIPGGLESIEKIKGEPIQQTLGYSSFKEKFKDLKESASQKMEQKQKQIWEQADGRKLYAIEKLQKQQPRIPLYDDLPERQQKMVFKEGQKQFEKQIQEQKQKIRDQMKGDLTPQKYIDKLKQVIPSGSVNSLLDRATQKFDQIAKGLKGGGLSDLAGKFF